MRDLKISIELVKVVMKDEGSFETIEINKNVLSAFGFLGYHIFTINIYEFAFKCKEWAYRNNYDIWSTSWGSVEFLNIEKYNGTERIDADTEVEAIIKACEWILKQTGN